MVFHQAHHCSSALPLNAIEEIKVIICTGRQVRQDFPI
jgi:hypothetical protein